jgi:hypothetical protein
MITQNGKPSWTQGQGLIAALDLRPFVCGGMRLV